VHLYGHKLRMDANTVKCFMLVATIFRSVKSSPVNDVNVKKSFDTNGNTDRCDEDIVSDKRGSMFGGTEQDNKKDTQSGPGQPGNDKPEARSSEPMNKLSLGWRDHSGADASSRSFLYQVTIYQTFCLLRHCRRGRIS